MTQLFEINVKLSDNQKKNLSTAYHKRETVVLRLSKDSLHWNDTLYIPATVVKRLEKNRKLRKGMNIKLAKTNIRKKVGGSLLSTVLTLGRTFAPTIAKTLGLSALAGLASEVASQVVKSISGKGVQLGGFLVPQDKIDKLIEYKHLLSTKQKQNILNALQSGSGVHVNPTKTQSGGFLGTLLASIGVPLLLNALTGKTGSGASRIGTSKKKGGKGAPRIGAYRQPPPFIGTWDSPVGIGIKKKDYQEKKNLSRKRKRGKVYY